LLRENPETIAAITFSGSSPTTKSPSAEPRSRFSFISFFPEDEVTISWDRITKHERHDLPIIYEDDDIIAINKPSGLLSTPSDREKGRTAYRLVSDYVTQKDRNNRIFIVHRFDEDTSGVLIFAKNGKSAKRFKNLGDIVTNRGYYAIVEGMDIPDEGTLKDYLAQDSTFQVYVVRNPSKGKLAITHYKKITAKAAILCSMSIWRPGARTKSGFS
jgi:23S rRNA-/tRNA-specific pseudouridylate synthase